MPEKYVTCIHCGTLDSRPHGGTPSTTLCPSCAGADGRAIMCRTCCPTGHRTRDERTFPAAGLRQCPAGRPDLRCIHLEGPHPLHLLRPASGYEAPIKALRTEEEGILDAYLRGSINEPQAARLLDLDRASLRERTEARRAERQTEGEKMAAAIGGRLLFEGSIEDFARAEFDHPPGRAPRLRSDPPAPSVLGAQCDTCKRSAPGQYIGFQCATLSGICPGIMRALDEPGEADHKRPERT